MSSANERDVNRLGPEATLLLLPSMVQSDALHHEEQRDRVRHF
jgi:hypothetical protein